jgi:hypothetical protein
MLIDLLWRVSAVLDDEERMVALPMMFPECASPRYIVMLGFEAVEVIMEYDGGASEGWPGDLTVVRFESFDDVLMKKTQ